MFTRSSDSYLAVKLPKYPHLLPADVLLWERFLDQYPDYFESVEYDVHVGGAVDHSPWWSDKFRIEASWLASKRIDVVGHRKGEIWIVELKPEAGLSAIGQLIGYELLYQKRYSPTWPLVKCLVTNLLTPDERFLTVALGIRTFQV